MAVDRSSPHFTARSAALLEAAVGDIEDGETVVDLGAGAQAVVAGALRSRFPACRIIAVEPVVEVEAREGIEVVQGDLRALPPAIADVILFNSPNTPDRFLDARDGSHHQFSGGPNGYDVLHDVLAAAPSCLRQGGRVVFICPTFTPLPDDLDLQRVRLLGSYAEPRDPFLARAPVRDEARPEFRRFLDSRLRRLRPLWAGLGVPEAPDAVSAAVLRWEPRGRSTAARESRARGPEGG